MHMSGSARQTQPGVNQPLFPTEPNEHNPKKVKIRRIFPTANINRGTPVDQHRLLPTDPKNWLSQDDVVHLLLLLLPKLDMSEFLAKYRTDGVGAAFYDPCAMLGIIIYAMARGEQSSRKIETLCKYDVGFHLVGNGLQPDHVTIYRFKKEFKDNFEFIFDQIARILIELGVVRFGTIAIDGSKFGSMASLSSNRKYKWVQSQLRQALDESMKKDEEENEEGLSSELAQFELPDHLGTNQELIAKFNRAVEVITEEQRVKAEQQQERIEQRIAEEENAGIKKPGRKLSEPQYIPSPDEKVNLTDPESKIMKTRFGFIQGYNAQILVDENQFVLAAQLTNDQNDQHQMIPLIEKGLNLIASTGTDEKPHTVLADGGYCSYEAILSEKQDGPRLLIATSKEYNITESDAEDGALFIVDEICRRMGENPPSIPILCDTARFVWDFFINKSKPVTPEGGAKAVMSARVRSTDGKKLYGKRKTMVESVFGNMKHNRRFRGFSLKGKDACAGEFFLALACHNIIKLHLMLMKEKVKSGKTFVQGVLTAALNTCADNVQRNLSVRPPASTFA